MNAGLTIQDTQGRPCSIHDVEWIALSNQHRGIRAIKRFFLFILIGCVGAPIPIVHFIVVPGAILLSIVGSILTYKERFHISFVKYQCSECKTQFEIKDKYYSNDKRDVCDNCRQQIKFIFIIGAS